MTLSTRYFNRTWELRAGLSGSPGLGWSRNRLAFSLEHTTASHPNECEAVVYNLDENERGYLEREGMIVQVSAGYGESRALLFQGELPKNSVQHEWDGKDWTTTLKPRDGDFAHEAAQFDFCFDGSPSFSQIVYQVQTAMGVPQVYIDPAIPAVTYPSGMTFFGPARHALDAVVKGLRLADGRSARWFIQDGSLVILADGSALPQEAYLVSPHTGLIGSPRKTDSGVELNMYLTPQIKPGRLIALNSRQFNGWYMVNKTKHTGDSRGNDWTTVVEATRR